MSSYRITVERVIEQTLIIKADNLEEAEYLAGIYGELLRIEEIKDGGEGNE